MQSIMTQSNFVNSLIFWLFCILFGISACTDNGDNNSKGQDFSFEGPDSSGGIVFESVTPGGYGELLNQAISQLPRVRISGTLFTPTTSAPYPAVVVGLGSTGSGAHQVELAQWLNTLGIAAFVIDSYGGRNVTNGQSISSAAEAVDALFALRVLASLPNVDANRIALLDFGAGMINTAFDEISAKVDTAGAAYQAYIVYYANCNIRQWSTNFTSAPMLFLHGELDEWNAATACESFVQQLQSLGANATIHIYPNAHHGFDSDGQLVTRTGYLSNVLCSGEFRLDTRVLANFDSGQIFSDGTAYRNYLNTCRQAVDMTTGGDATAKAQGRSEVSNLLSTVFQ